MRWRAGLVSLGVWGLIVPASAGAATGGSATMSSEAGDYIGGGRQQIFDAQAGDRVVGSLSSDGAALGVSVSGGTYGASYNMTFVAPDGPLRPGVYVGAQRAPFREAGRPGIDVSGDGRGCNTISGSFEVRELVTAADGSVQRAWILYEQHCEGGTAALFGEVRIGEPSRTVPTLLRWPARDVGGGGQAVPVSIGAPPGGGAITNVSVGGAAAADFVVRVDECTGATPPPGGACEVWVRFVPTAPGTRLAWLRVTDASGGQADVPLQAFAYGGSTGLTMQSDPGDYIGGGTTWTYGADSSFGVYGSRSFASVSVDGANGDWWYLDFEPAAGDVLAPGTYTGATRYPFNGTGAGLSISGEGRGCNELSGSFTVNEFTTDRSALRTLSISFEQHCEHSPAALRGTFNFRAGDTTAPAPWMVSSNAPVDVGTPPGSGTPAPPTAEEPAPATPAPAQPVSPASPAAAAAATPSAIAVERNRVAASTQALLKATAKLRPRDGAKVRTAAARLSADLGRYRAALKAAKPATAEARRALATALRALDRQASALRQLRSALNRYAAGSQRRAAAARTIARAAKTVAASERSAATASSRLLT